MLFPLIMYSCLLLRVQFLSKPMTWNHGAVNEIDFSLPLFTQRVDVTAAHNWRHCHAAVQTRTHGSSLRAESMSSQFPCPAAAPFRHLSPLRIHEFLCLQACDWLLMNKRRCYQSASATATKYVSRDKRNTSHPLVWKHHSTGAERQWSPEGDWHIGYCWLRGTFDMTPIIPHTCLWSSADILNHSW